MGNSKNCSILFDSMRLSQKSRRPVVAGHKTRKMKQSTVPI